MLGLRLFSKSLCVHEGQLTPGWNLWTCVGVGSQVPIKISPAVFIRLKQIKIWFVEGGLYSVMVVLVRENWSLHKAMYLHIT